MYDKNLILNHIHFYYFIVKNSKYQFWILIINIFLLTFSLKIYIYIYTLFISVIFILKLIINFISELNIMHRFKSLNFT